MAKRRRPYDIVLFGATGFTGGLTAEYLARTVPPNASWALAGRNRAKLEAVRGRLGGLWSELPLLSADAADPDSLRELAQSTRLIVTTVGPYANSGEPLVAACAEAGTDYLDLTGEPEFVDRCYVRYHARAVETGARLVHSCGFDSIPYDLGAYFTVHQLPEGVPLRLRGFVRASAMFSGGTYQSAITAFSRIRPNLAATRGRNRAEPPLTDRRARAVGGRLHHDRDARAWAVPLPTIDGQVVGRSARALDRYGPDFTYSHFAAVKRLPSVLGGAGCVLEMQHDFRVNVAGGEHAVVGQAAGVLIEAGHGGVSHQPVHRVHAHRPRHDFLVGEGRDGAPVEQRPGRDLHDFVGACESRQK